MPGLLVALSSLEWPRMTLSGLSGLEVGLSGLDFGLEVGLEVGLK